MMSPYLRFGPRASCLVASPGDFLLLLLLLQAVPGLEGRLGLPLVTAAQVQKLVERLIGRLFGRLVENILALAGELWLEGPGQRSLVIVAWLMSSGRRSLVGELLLGRPGWITVV